MAHTVKKDDLDKVEKLIKELDTNVTALQDSLGEVKS